MTKKASRQNWLSGYSQLARYYIKAHKEIRKVAVYIPKKQLEQISAFEVKLRKADIEPKDYSYTIITVMGEWARKRKMSNIPVNIFCSSYSIERYKKVRSKFVNIDVTNEGELLYSELLVGRMYVQESIAAGLLLDMDNIVEEIAPALSKDWKELYASGKVRMCELDALDIISLEHGIRNVDSYKDLVEKIWIKMDTHSAETSG